MANEELQKQQLDKFLHYLNKQEQSTENLKPDDFVELHFHTEHSSLDGATRIEDVAKVAKEHGQIAIAVTDHGTMSGLFDVYKQCKKEGVKLLPAMEPYIVDDATKAHVPRKRRGRKKLEEKTEEDEQDEDNEQQNLTSPDWESHIVLIAKNEIGYRNLLKLHYLGYLHKRVNTFGRVIPRIDFSLLEQYKEGLIVGTACLGGQISQAIIRNSDDLARQLVIKYKQVFGENLFIEIQPIGVQPDDRLEYRNTIIEETERLQAFVNDRLVQLALEYNIRICCTSDAHYAKKEDRETHALLLAIQSKKDITDESCFFFPAPAMQSANEMVKQFPVEWIRNTRQIADMCEEPKYLEFGKDYKIPSFPLDDVEDLEEFNEWKQSFKV